MPRHSLLFTLNLALSTLYGSVPVNSREKLAAAEMTCPAAMIRELKKGLMRI